MADTAFRKKMAKDLLQIYTGVTLMRMSREMGKKKMEELQQNSINEPAPIASPQQSEFGFPESSVVRLIGVISSFLETTLKNGLEVDPFLMKEAQEILNNLQELLEFKQEYYRKVQNGNQAKR